jgi:hypothetical protein
MAWEGQLPIFNPNAMSNDKAYAAQVDEGGDPELSHD